MIEAEKEDVATLDLYIALLYFFLIWGNLTIREIQINWPCMNPERLGSKGNWAHVKKLKMWAVTNCMCCQLTPRRREKCGSKKFDNTRNVCLVCSAKVCHMKTGAFDCGGTHADVQNTTPCKSHLINTHHCALNINRKMLSVHLCNQECSLKVNFVLS